MLLAFFVGLAIISSTANKILSRVAMRDISPYAFAVFVNLGCALFFLPLALMRAQLPSDPRAWGVLSIASILWAAIAIVGLFSVRGTQISLREPVSQSKLLWGLLFSVVLLGEAVSLQRALGIIVIFIGITLSIWHPERKLGRLSDSGIQWTLLGAFLGALVAAVDKHALQYFPLEMYGFLVFLLPTIVLLFFYKKRRADVVHVFRYRWRFALLTSMTLAVLYYSTLQVFKLMEFSLAYSLLQLSTLLAVLSGVVYLREREHILQRIIATVIVIAGAILLKV